MKTFCILVLILQMFVSEGLIDNNSALIQVPTLCMTCDKPIPEPMLTQFQVHI